MRANQYQKTPSYPQKVEHLEKCSGLAVDGWRKFGKEFFRFRFSGTTMKTCGSYGGAKQFAVGVQFGRRLGR